MTQATTEQRRRDKILRALLVSVDEDRWFSRQDFGTTVAEFWGDPRTVRKYWDNLVRTGVIETVAMRGKEVYGRLSEEVYDKLDANGTTLDVSAEVKITGRGRGRPKLIDAEMLL